MTIQESSDTRNVVPLMESRSDVSVLMIQGPGEPGLDPAKVSVDANEVATFGLCKCDDCHLDLRLTAVPPVQFRGQIVAGPDRWQIENLSGSEPLVVADVDSQAATTVIMPRESMSFTHDMAVITSFDHVIGLSVVVSFSSRVNTVTVGQSCPAIAMPRLELDPSSRYFAVLAALCEHVLKGRAGRVPTSSDIAAQLALSPRAVDSHIDYLVGKFNIPAPANRSTGWKRRALIRNVRVRKDIAHLLRVGAKAGAGQLVAEA